MEIVFSLKFKVSMVPYFHDLIKEHEERFRTLFPDIHLINKHHHLLHYPECIRKSGPLHHAWCMRFEAKRNMFKRHGSIWPKQ